MANAITKFKKYISKIDDVYKQASKTAILDSDETLAREGANANEIIIPKISMEGLGDYDRNTGYTKGDVTLTDETVSFNYDRGRKFSVDAMDNEETAGIAFGKLASEFIRTKVVPEIDAFRFATYASKPSVGKVEETLADGNAVLTSLVLAQSVMDDAEVPEEGRILFITPAFYNSVMNVDTTKSKEVLASFSAIVKVPQSRFYTAIKLNNGVSGEKAGGYTKAEGAADINYMIIEKSALMQYRKHLVNKVISPEENQTDDGWMFFYRSYGLADVYENKVAGIYFSHKRIIM